MQKPLTQDVVKSAFDFVKACGSERAAERKARRFRKMMIEMADSSPDLKEKLFDKHKLDQLNISISDKNNYLDQISEKLTNILK